MIWSIIKLFGNITLGAIVSFTLVAYYIYDRDRRKEEPKKETPFEDLYKSELQEVRSNESLDENITNNIVFDYKCMEFPSPYGMVYMKIKDIKNDIQNDYEVINNPMTNDESPE